MATHGQKRRRPAIATALLHERDQPADGRGGSFGRKRPLLRIAAAASALISLLVSAGCSYTAAPADLLQAPAVDQTEAALSAAVGKLLPRGSKLQLPDRGDRTEAVRTVDLDGDGAPEALVSYTDYAGLSKLMILKQEQGVWTTWGEMAGSRFNGLEWVKVTDLDGDKQPEILVGCYNNNGSVRRSAFGWEYMLYLYTMDKNRLRDESGAKVLQPLANFPYQAAAAGDVDGDDRQEIAAVQSDANGISQLVIYHFSGGRLKLASRLAIEGSVNAYTGIAIGKLTPDRYGLIADASVGANSGLSIIVEWDNGLKRLYPAEDEAARGNNPRSVVSGDINGDGILEWPRLVVAPGQTDAAISDAFFLTQYVRWNEKLGKGESPAAGQDPFTVVSTEYNNDQYGISVQIPNRWQGLFAMTRPDGKAYGVASFDYYNEKSGVAANMWTLYAVPQDEWDSVQKAWKDQSLQSVYIRAANGLVYAAIVTPGPPDSWTQQDKDQFGTMLPDEEQIASAVRLLPEP
ncbi:FG-GAP repeat domain-containing protein [Paenibacillus beijingensis]|uniref:VCBS repeat-containing protein n=1 Tax=Paenibacillus beijingensis TaxID=1126833 RepID=A0A0D5NGE8_9BACL|nr:VCBS repeat-containing protein [Paenibacillus beijingensis]AJY74336.1 hypothetical protein VN24_06790 [Paenibacillus beijingensis]